MEQGQVLELQVVPIEDGDGRYELRAVDPERSPEHPEARACFTDWGVARYAALIVRMGGVEYSVQPQADGRFVWDAVDAGGEVVLRSTTRHDTASEAAAAMLRVHAGAGTAIIVDAGG